MKKITNIRKAVCMMANNLRKAGYSLSQAFKKAWKRVRFTMTIRATGTTTGNRQNILEFLKQFRTEDLTATLEREKENQHDKNAIRIVAHIKPLKKKAVIGYVPRILAAELAKVIDMGIPVTATFLQVIGGYSYKENLGALINITI